MNEKKSYQGMTPIRSQYVELKDSLAALQGLQLARNEIGRMYVGFLFENEPSIALANLKPIKGELEREEFSRIIKRRAQWQTAFYFCNAADNLRHQELKPEEIVPDLDVSITQYKFSLDFSGTGVETIESVVNSLLNDRNTCFANIGDALIEGAEKYLLAAGNVIRLPRPRLHLQYDAILRALKRKVDDKTTTIL